MGNLTSPQLPEEKEAMSKAACPGLRGITAEEGRTESPGGAQRTKRGGGQPEKMDPPDLPPGSRDKANSHATSELMCSLKGWLVRVYFWW